MKTLALSAVALSALALAASAQNFETTAAEALRDSGIQAQSKAVSSKISADSFEMGRVLMQSRGERGGDRGRDGGRDRDRRRDDERDWDRYTRDRDRRDREHDREWWENYNRDSAGRRDRRELEREAEERARRNRAPVQPGEPPSFEYHSPDTRPLWNRTHDWSNRDYGRWHGHPGWGNGRAWVWREDRPYWWGWAPFVVAVGSTRLACVNYYDELETRCDSDCSADNVSCSASCQQYAPGDPACPEQCSTNHDYCYWNCRSDRNLWVARCPY